MGGPTRLRACGLIHIFYFFLKGPVARTQSLHCCNTYTRFVDTVTLTPGPTVFICEYSQIILITRKR